MSRAMFSRTLLLSPTYISVLGKVGKTLSQSIWEVNCDYASL